MTIFEDHFQKISFHKEINTIEQEFFVKDESLYGENYKKEVLLLLDACIRYKPEKILIHNGNSDHIIDEELQVWIQTEFNPKLIELGVTCKAYVLSPEIFSMLSTELVAEQNVELGIHYKLFDNKPEALAWLGACF